MNPLSIFWVYWGDTITPEKKTCIRDTSGKKQQQNITFLPMGARNLYSRVI
jgi:hypothetical protein